MNNRVMHQGKQSEGQRCGGEDRQAGAAIGPDSNEREQHHNHQIHQALDEQSGEAVAVIDRMTPEVE